MRTVSAMSRTMVAFVIANPFSRSYTVNTMSRTLVAIVAAVVLASGSSAWATLLDDYSTDKSADYVSYLWNSSPAMSFARTGGMLTPTGDGNWVGSGFYWNGGRDLEAR